MAFSWFLGQGKREPASRDDGGEAQDAAAEITLRIEDGLLMAFGPEGDPVPPVLVKSILEASSIERLPLEGRGWVARRPALDVLEAQQKAPLADHPSDRWVEAMLGLDGGFEDTPSERLAGEPAGSTPTLPDLPAEGHGDWRYPFSEWVTPLALDDAEIEATDGADALLVHGLGAGMKLSVGRFDAAVNGWVVRPPALPAMAVERADGAATDADISVTAISIQGKGRRWPIAARRIALA